LTKNPIHYEFSRHVVPAIGRAPLTLHLLPAGALPDI